MGKILVMTVICLIAGCDRMPHIVWSQPKKEVTQEEQKPKLNTDLNGVEFTFDDGPDLAKTPKILDALKVHNLHATFFVLGINLAGDSVAAQARRALLVRMVKEGHTIGNHSYDHKDMCRMSPSGAASELDRTTKLIEETTGQKVTLVRPPYGKKCKMLNNLLAYRGLTAVYWEIDPREWERDPGTHQVKTAQQVTEGILAQYRTLHFDQGLPKMTIILHDTKAVTVDLLPGLLNRLPKEVAKTE